MVSVWAQPLAGTTPEYAAGQTMCPLLLTSDIYIVECYTNAFPTVNCYTVHSSCIERANITLRTFVSVNDPGQAGPAWPGKGPGSGTPGSRSRIPGSVTARYFIFSSRLAL